MGTPGPAGVGDAVGTLVGVGTSGVATDDATWVDVGELVPVATGMGSEPPLVPVAVGVADNGTNVDVAVAAAVGVGVGVEPAAGLDLGLPWPCGELGPGPSALTTALPDAAMLIRRDRVTSHDAMRFALPGMGPRGGSL